MKKKINKQTRRQFLQLGFREAQQSEDIKRAEQAVSPTEDTREKVKMLTAQGDLVEIDAEVFKKLKSGRPSKNTDILNWVDKKSPK